MLSSWPWKRLRSFPRLIRMLLESYDCLRRYHLVTKRKIHCQNQPQISLKRSKQNTCQTLVAKIGEHRTCTALTVSTRCAHSQKCCKTTTNKTQVHYSRVMVWVSRYLCHRASSRNHRWTTLKRKMI